MISFPFTGYCNLNDILTLGLVLICILLWIKAACHTSKHDEDLAVLTMSTIVIVSVGFINFALNWIFDSFTHAWKFALIWPGIFLLPLTAILLAAKVVTYITSAPQRRHRRQAQKRKRYLEKNHDKILTNLQQLSQSYKERNGAAPDLERPRASPHKV